MALAEIDVTPNALPLDSIICGDALAVLRTLPDNSLDAIVTDPPAGISFMGKHWDSDKGGRDAWIAWLAEVMAEAWRVIKPGGHALVWALPRTSHWTAMALEDAGWEIRDRVAAINGQGFPKSLDPYKAAQNSGTICQCPKGGVHYPIKGAGNHVSDEDLRSMRQAVAAEDALSGGTEYDMLLGMRDETGERATQGQRASTRPDLPILREGVSTEITYSAEQGEALQQSLRGSASAGRSRVHRTPAQNGAQRTCGMDSQEPHELSGEDERREEPGMEGRCDAQAHTRQLSGRDVRQMPNGISANGAQGWLRDGASASDGTEDRTMPSPRRSRASHRPQPSEQSPRQSATLPQQPRPQTCRSCGKPIWPHEPGALGTALKPAVEDWWLVRKPLSEKNVAANVLRWGTGALNIGASRVKTDDTLGRAKGGWPKGGYVGGESPQWNSIGTTVEGGRWPANLLLSHAPDCGEHGCSLWCPVRALDAQSGITPRGGQVKPYTKRHVNVSSYSIKGDMTYESGPRDTGGASRYFQTFKYQPKASRAERNRGCEALPTRAIKMPGKQTGFTPSTGAITDGYTGERSNTHPTVKPLALMSWLIGLITPPGGIVLDPFAGSGSTLCAAKAGGWRYIGIEKEPEYVAIARSRVRAS